MFKALRISALGLVTAHWLLLAVNGFVAPWYLSRNNFVICSRVENSNWIFKYDGRRSGTSQWVKGPGESEIKYESSTFQTETPGGVFFSIETDSNWLWVTTNAPLPTIAIGHSLMLSALFVPNWLRRYVRRRRNQCLHCAYDLTGNTSGVCPECGTNIDDRKPT